MYKNAVCVGRTKLKHVEIECGHYENLSLDEAKKECRAYLKVLESQTNMEFTYPQ
jgi:S-ribosylhomocysteine lyase LuxS involved in autoinducer biosynthesis